MALWRNEGGWVDAADDGRGKTALAALALALVLAAGVAIDQARSCSSEAPAGEGQAIGQEAGTEPSRQDGPALAQKDSEEPEDAEVMSGVTFTHVSRLGEMAAQDRMDFGRVVAAWMASRGIEADRVDVIESLGGPQGAPDVRIEAGGVPAEATCSPDWAVTDSDGTVAMPSSSEAGAVSSVPLGDREALAIWLGEDCALGLASAWDSWAETEGVGQDSWTTSLDPTSVSSSADGALSFSLLSGESRWDAAWSAGTGFSFAEEGR